MATLTPEEAMSYLNRWKLVREVEAQELSNSSFDTRLQQLSVLMASRELFPQDPNREAMVQTVRDRWIRIRQAFNDRRPPDSTP